jgi:hypothetical protein
VAVTATQLLSGPCVPLLRLRPILFGTVILSRMFSVLMLSESRGLHIGSSGRRYTSIDWSSPPVSTNWGIARVNSQNPQIFGVRHTYKQGDGTTYLLDSLGASKCFKAFVDVLNNKWVLYADNGSCRHSIPWARMLLGGVVAPRIAAVLHREINGGPPSCWQASAAARCLEDGGSRMARASASFLQSHLTKMARAMRKARAVCTESSDVLEPKAVCPWIFVPTCMPICNALPHRNGTSLRSPIGGD